MAIPASNDTLLALAMVNPHPSYHRMGQEGEVEAMLTARLVFGKAIACDGEGATCLIEVQVSTDEKLPVRLPEPLLVHLLSNQLSLVVTPTGRVLLQQLDAGVPLIKKTAN